MAASLKGTTETDCMETVMPHSNQPTATNAANNVVYLFGDPDLPDGSKRLIHATLEMHIQTRHQLRNVRTFQATMAELDMSIKKLGRTCQRLKSETAKIRINRLRRKSLMLARTMDCQDGWRYSGVGARVAPKAAGRAAAI